MAPGSEPVTPAEREQGHNLQQEIKSQERAIECDLMRAIKDALDPQGLNPARPAPAF